MGFLKYFPVLPTALGELSGVWRLAQSLPCSCHPSASSQICSQPRPGSSRGRSPGSQPFPGAGASGRAVGQVDEIATVVQDKPGRPHGCLTACVRFVSYLRPNIKPLVFVILRLKDFGVL